MLKRLRERGEIDQEQYDALRRHVLWGTPLPDSLERTLSPEVLGNLSGGTAQADAPPADGLRRFTPALPAGRRPERTERPDPPERPEPTRPERNEFQGPRRSRTPQEPGGPHQPGPRRPDRRRQPPDPRQQPRQPPPRRSTPAPPRSADTDPAEPANAPPPAPAPQPAHSTAPPAAPRRRRIWPYVAAAAVLVVLVVGGTAGWWFYVRDDDGITPAAYAAAVCPIIGDWRSDVQAAAGKLPGDLDRAGGRPGQKRIAEKYYADAAARTDQLIPELEKVTAPDGSDNAAYAADLATAAKTADGRFHNLAAQVDELEPAGKKSFTEALHILTDHPDDPVQAVTALVAHGRPPADLDDAFAGESSCQSLR